MNQGDQFGFETQDGQRVKLGSGMAGYTYLGWVRLNRRLDGTQQEEPRKVQAALKEIRNVREGGGYSLKREVMLLALVGKLNDPRFVTFLSFFFHQQIPYIATELVTGMTMEYLLRQATTLPDEGLSAGGTGRILEWGVQLAGALEALQSERIVHRDIKPSNVIIRESDGLPVLIDFGVGQSEVVRQRDGTTTVSPAHFVGTPAYASPEQIDQPDNITYKSDIYSLGATLWSALTHRPVVNTRDRPFEEIAQLKRAGKHDVTLLPDIPLLRALLDRTLQGDPEHRPGPKELRQELSAILETSFDARPTVRHVAARPAKREPSGRKLQPLPPFVTIDDEVEIATSLLSVYGLNFWAPRTAAQIDFDATAAHPAQTTYTEAMDLVESINSDPETVHSPWRYRLQTAREWRTAAGFTAEGGRSLLHQRFRCLLEDASGVYEWADEPPQNRVFPECRSVVYLQRKAPHLAQRHLHWPKGGIRLVRVPRAAFSEESSASPPAAGV